MIRFVFRFGLVAPLVCGGEGLAALPPLPPSSKRTTVTATVGRGGDSAPRVWISVDGLETKEDVVRAVDDCARHGVQVFTARPNGWSDEMLVAVLAACREKGLKITFKVSDATFRLPSPEERDTVEYAVLNGGAYQRLAIDRTLFTFTPEKHTITIEPPVYTLRQGKAIYMRDVEPTGLAEVVVPEKLFDGRQHIRILPATVTRSNAFVRLTFDLSDCAACRLDKVGLAVYWRAATDKRCERSLYAASTGAALRELARAGVARWTCVNGGTFPSDTVLAARIGDEVFNHTSLRIDQYASRPLWGFSPSALKRYAEIYPKGETYPRTWGATEVYGRAAAARFLYERHQATARYLRGAIDELHAVGLLCYRNTTRCGCWSYNNDHDGTGQEVLAGVFDFLHLDPYPCLARNYSSSVIPMDLAYMKGLSRRFKKPINLWMQAHEFTSGGLVHPTPDMLTRMYNQMLEQETEALTWLGYGASWHTFPKARPDSWERAAELHAAFRQRPMPHETRPALAVVRPYESRAAMARWNWWKNNIELSEDELLYRFVLRWVTKHHLPYDIYEVPPGGYRGAEAAELSQYRFVVSAGDFPGATNVAARSANGQHATGFDAERLADTLAAWVGGAGATELEGLAFDTTVTSRATGYFRLEQETNGVWRFVTPGGHGFFLAANNGPSKMCGESCPALGYAPYTRTLQAKFGKDRARWAAEETSRLKAWKFNAIASWDPPAKGLIGTGLASLRVLQLGKTFADATPNNDSNLLDNVRFTGRFPNVFRADFADHCRKICTKTCAKERENPWIVGWCTDNELVWRGAVGKSANGTSGDAHDGTGMYDAVAVLPTTHTGRQALDAFLAKRGLQVGDAGVTTAVKQDFLRLVAETYFRVTTSAVREAAPNHLVLGCRFAGARSTPDLVWEIGGQWNDAMSINTYPPADLTNGYIRAGWTSGKQPYTANMRAAYKRCKRPIIVTEWAFPAKDTPCPCKFGGGHRMPTQKERAAATALMARTLMDEPEVVGYAHFKWCDNPALGRWTKTGGEDCNYGLVNVQDEPYQLLTETFTTVHGELYDRRHRAWHTLNTTKKKGKHHE